MSWHWEITNHAMTDPQPSSSDLTTFSVKGLKTMTPKAAPFFDRVCTDCFLGVARFINRSTNPNSVHILSYDTPIILKLSVASHE